MEMLKEINEGRSDFVHYDPRKINLARLRGIYVTSDGYVKCLTPLGHPAHKLKRIYLHRLVMEKKIGRCLRPKEVVHHIDRNKRNNSVENLELFSSEFEHKSLRHRNGEQRKRYVLLQDHNWLERKYLGEGKAMGEIAEELGCDPVSVRSALIRFGIKKRKYTLSNKAIEGRRKGARACKPKKIKWCDPSWIKRQYIEKERSFRDIGKELGWHKNKVKRFLEGLGVELRTHKQQATMAILKRGKEWRGWYE